MRFNLNLFFGVFLEFFLLFASFTGVYQSLTSPVIEQVGYIVGPISIICMGLSIAWLFERV